MYRAETLNMYRKTLKNFRNWRDIEFDCFTVSRNALHYFGPRPLIEEIPSKLMDTWRTMQTNTSFGIGIYNTVIGLPMMAYVSVDNDFSLCIESLAAVFISSMVVSAYFCVVCQNEKLESLFQAKEVANACCLKMPRLPESILSSNRRQSTILARMLIVILAAVPSVFLTLPKIIQERTLINKFWYPFDAYIYPVYPFVLLITSIAHVGAMVILVTHVMILIAMLFEVAGLFRVLSFNLSTLHANNMQDDSPWIRALRRARKDEELKMCVQLHYSIIRYIEEIQSTYNLFLFLTGVALLVPNGLGIALVAFTEEIDSQTVTFILIIVVGNVIGLGLFWAADKVADESEAVREAIYDGDWFDQSEGFKRSMRIIMSRCNQPVVFSAGGLIRFSMATYYDVTKLTYSYCMALWTTLSTKH